MFQEFCNMEFSDSLLDNKREMSLDDKRALEIMESSTVLKEGHHGDIHHLAGQTTEF